MVKNDRVISQRGDENLGEITRCISANFSSGAMPALTRTKNLLRFIISSSTFTIIIFPVTHSFTTIVLPCAILFKQNCFAGRTLSFSLCLSCSQILAAFEISNFMHVVVSPKFLHPKPQGENCHDDPCHIFTISWQIESQTLHLPSAL